MDKRTEKEIPVEVGYVHFLLAKQGAVDALLAILPHLSPREIVGYRTDFANLGVSPERILLEMHDGQYSAEVVECFIQDGVDVTWIAICMSRVNRVKYYKLLAENGAEIDLPKEAKKLTYKQAYYCRAVLAEYGYTFKRRRNGGIRLKRSR